MIQIVLAGNYQQFLDHVRSRHLNLRRCIPIMGMQDVWKLRGQHYHLDQIVVAQGTFWHNPDAGEVWDYIITTSFCPDRAIPAAVRYIPADIPPDVGKGMLIEELLDESTLQWLQRVKERKASNVKADEISERQEAGHAQSQS